MDARLSLDFSASYACPAPESWTNELIRSHSRLVDRIARRVFREMSSPIAIEDLVQIGKVALVEAARNFVDRGTAQFSTYATIRVRGAMIDELRKSATISRSALRQRRQFATARQELATSLGRAPDDREMAEKLGMAGSAYRATIDSFQTIEYTSIDDVDTDTSSWFTDSAPSADEAIDEDRRRKAIAAAVGTLPEREQVVLQMYFVDEISLEDIGKVFAVGPARICQIKRTALEKLRKTLAPA